MSIKSLARIGLLATLSMSAIGAFAAPAAPVQTYQYGQHLDVKKVLSIHEKGAPTCGVVTERMDYLDSAGQLRSVQYQAYDSDACHEGG